MSDGGANYSAAHHSEMGIAVTGDLSHTIIFLNTVILWGAVGLGLSQIPFIINFFWSMRNGEPVKNDNPWDSTTLEWQTPTPPGHGNFLKEPIVYHGPYEYSVPGHPTDFIPQNERLPEKASPGAHH
jgi:cytochrome c oxidase subunit 1